VLTKRSYFSLFSEGVVFCERKKTSLSVGSTTCFYCETILWRTRNYNNSLGAPKKNCCGPPFGPPPAGFSGGKIFGGLPPKGPQKVFRGKKSRLPPKASPPGFFKRLPSGEKFSRGFFKGPPGVLPPLKFHPQPDSKFWVQVFVKVN